MTGPDLTLAFETALQALPETLRDGVQHHWAGFSEACDEAPRLETDLLQELCRVWAVSDFVAQRCARQPRLLLELLGSGDLHQGYNDGDMRGRVDAVLQTVEDVDTLHRQLRRQRQREMLRIAWRDIAGLADLNETMADVSALADSCIEGALQWLQARLIDEVGQPRDAAGEPQSLVVLGMGKLGAGELNFSSDVDLIFAYAEAGATEHSSGRSISNEEFFTRLGRQLIRALDETTADGFVFRVDMRLRPFGQSGALASSFDAMENYYQVHGRDWERYAFIKARVVAGDRAAGERLFEVLRPFVFRRYLDYGAFEALRDMKAMVEAEVKRKGMANHVKLGAGGIREVEFIGQAFQLVRGGREPALQQREIQRVLVYLGEQDYLPAYAVQQLLAAYEFLRNTEHRLQEYQDQQTHRLPEDELGRQRLAFGMGFGHWEEFIPVLRGHMMRVHSHFEQVFAAPQTGHAEADTSGLSEVWLGGLGEQEAVAALAAAGFVKAEDTWNLLHALQTGRLYPSLSTTGRQRLDHLMPLLLGAVIEIQQDLTSPDEVLQRLLKLVEGIARRSAYLALLIEHPMALSQLVRLFAASPWIAQQVAHHPLLLDELLDPRSLYSPPGREELESDLRSRLAQVEGDLERAMDVLRQFKQASVLRVAAADVMEAVPLMRVSDHLTDIAEVIVTEVLELAWSDLVTRNGRPSCAHSDEAKGFAIVAYGKMGGIELGYGSDLDLVFVHGSEDANAMTDGAKPVADAVFFARLGQRIIHIMTAHTPAGVLYEADMRLRPSGASGLLVVGLPAFREYQESQAWTWEHQALVRARVVAGDPQIGAGFEAVRRSVLGRQRETPKLQQEIVEMRERMRQSLDKSAIDEGKFDLKQGAGGIADIEFMVQFQVLNGAHRFPALCDYTDNIRLLASFAEYGLMAAEDATVLSDAYRALRAEAHRLTLQEQPALTTADRFVEERAAVVRLWQQMLAVKH
jgi:glutamate-ammonia-ligase adenylyltransferase